MNERRAWLVFALGWCLLMGWLAIAFAIVTPREIPAPGVQPRVSLVSYFGSASVLLLAVPPTVLIVWWLVGRTGGVSTARLVAARLLSVAMACAWLWVVAFTHAVGLFATPTVLALWVVTWRARTSMSKWSDVPRQVGIQKGDKRGMAPEW